MIVRLSPSRLLAALGLSLAVATLIASSASHALTLGEAATQSALGQPLRISIPLQNATEDELRNDCFRLVPGASSGNGMPGLVTARVSVERGASGARAVVTTRKPVSDPAVVLTLFAQCRLSLQREYVVLLDPPINGDANFFVAELDAQMPSPTRLMHESKPAQTTSSLDNPPVRTKTAVATVAMNKPAVNNSANVRPEAGRPEAETPTRRLALDPVMLGTPMLPPPVAVSASAFPDAIAPARNGGATIVTHPISPISSAAAASLPRAHSPSLADASAHDAGIWQRSWPIAASFGAGGFMSFIGYLFYRRRSASASPLWLSKQKASGSATIAPSMNDLDTFAQLGGLTEPNFPSATRASGVEGKRHEPSLEVASLDTLFGEINEDAIEERALRDAWAVAQRGLSDPGSGHAVLQAIANAERELAISDVTLDGDDMEIDLDDHIIASNEGELQLQRRKA